jgi:hypothetical protein
VIAFRQIEGMMRDDDLGELVGSPAEQRTHARDLLVADPSTLESERACRIDAGDHHFCVDVGGLQTIAPNRITDALKTARRAPYRRGSIQSALSIGLFGRFPRGK